MHTQRLLFSPIAALACLALALPSFAAAPPAQDGDAQLLRSAGVVPDDQGLRKLLRQHSFPDLGPETVRKLIRQLGAETFVERELAERALVAAGPVVLPVLRRGLTERPDLEVARRVAACVETIERNDRKAVCLACVRLLVRRRHSSASESLLCYLPSALDDGAEEAVVRGLDELARADGKPGPALIAALKDVAPSRRAAAACIVGRIGTAEQRAAVRGLLRDPAPVVRLRAAQGLLAGADKAGLTALVALLDEPAPALAWQAEELLHWAAGESAPDAVVGEKRCRAVWEDWLRGPGARLDLRTRGSWPRPGLFLITEGGHAFDSPMRTVLCGCDGWPRRTWMRDQSSPLAPPKHTTWAELEVECVLNLPITGNPPRSKLAPAPLRRDDERGGCS